MAEFKRSLAAAAMALAGAAAVFSGSAFAKTYLVATDSTFPPFEFRDRKTNELIGFEVDLVHAMCEKLGAEVEIREFKFDAILPAILTGSIDFAAAGFAVTPERAKRVDFLDPFYKSALTIIVPKGNPGGIKTFDDLKGKRIAVQLASISHDHAKKIPDAKITTFDSAGDAMLELLAGNADAVVNATAATDYMLATRPTLGNRLDRLDVTANPTDMAMIVPKNNPELYNALNKALADLRADGTYDKLHAKWFGRPSKQ